MNFSLKYRNILNKIVIVKKYILQFSYYLTHIPIPYFCDKTNDVAFMITLLLLFIYILL